MKKGGDTKQRILEKGRERERKRGELNRDVLNDKTEREKSSMKVCVCVSVVCMCVCVFVCVVVSRCARNAN
jgi:hypothetical protein